MEINEETLRKREKDVFDAGFEAGIELAKAAPDLYEALVEVQWADGGLCPQCGRYEGSSHQPKCTLALALARAEGKEL